MEQAIQHILVLITGFCDMDSNLKHQMTTNILPKLANARTVYEHFLKGQTASIAEDETGVEDGSGAAMPAASALEELKESLNRIGAILTDLLYGLYAGTFDHDLKAIAATSASVHSVLQSAADSDSKDNKGLGGSLGGKVREVLRLVALATRGIEARTDGSAPQTGLRSLIQRLSNPDDQDPDHAAAKEERESVWRQAVAVRKRFATLSVASTTDSMEAFRTAFNSSGSVHKFNGILNESHRLFVASADLIQDHGSEPWQHMCDPPQNTWLNMMQFLNSRDGARDFVLAFDGRSRESRRAAEDNIKRAHGGTSELWILYMDCLKRAGRSRSTALSAENREVGILGLPCSRTKLKIEKRNELNICGEISTFFTTYSGVGFRRTLELPLLSADAKSGILSNWSENREVLPATWMDKHGKQEPLFWQESKPISYWLCMLADFRIKAVFDLTAGSGALAEACMHSGVIYHGLCLNTKHMAWLSSVLDRAACAMITQSDAVALFQQDLAAMLHKHFKDLVEEHATRLEEADPDDDEPDVSDDDKLS